MWKLTIRTLYDQRNLVLGYSIVAVLLLWLYIGIFPTFQGQAEQLNQVIAQLPEAFLKAFNITDLSQSMSSVESYLSSKHFALMWPLMSIMLSIGLAGNNIASEIESGRIEFLLSQPISRVKLFLGRWISSAIILLLFTITSVLTAIPIAQLYGIGIEPVAYWYMTVIGYMFSLSVLSLSMMVSALVTERSKVTLMTSLLMLGTYILNIVAELVPDYEKLKYFSAFHYMDANMALINHSLSVQSIVVFLGVSLITVCVGLVGFSRRDIAI
ncbi:ABC transporter permease subunit [candidate division WWE3 bacterium]|nr:ABC transporter permease subunit [candidate division WWE3 bacterium]